MIQRQIEIYELLDLRSNVVRYVGQSINARRRLNWHIAAARRGLTGRVYNWIRTLLRRNREPVMRIAVVCIDSAEANAVETALIAKRRSEGCDLTNCTDGGGGVRGRKHTLEAKRKIGDTHRGKVVSVESRRKNADWHRGRRASASTRRAMSVSGTGRIVSPETRGLISERMRGNKHALGLKRSQTTLDKMSLALSGTKSPTAKLTDAKIKEMRSAINAGVTQVALAVALGVSTATVSRALHGVTYRHHIELEP